MRAARALRVLSVVVAPHDALTLTLPCTPQKRAAKAAEHAARDAAAVHELEQEGARANRVKGADSPVPMRCVRAFTGRVARAAGGGTCFVQPLHGARTSLLPRSDSFDATLGLPIYSMDQLKMGKGGGTPACPFDCDCCF